MHLLQNIIIHFLYECPIEPIDTSLLVEELTSLNNIINKFPLINEKENKRDEEVGGNKRTKTNKNKKRINNKTKRK